MMNAWRLFLGLSGSLAAASMAAAAMPSPAWEIHEAERFCYAWRVASGASETEFGIAVDVGGRTTLILTNPAWRLEDRKDYPLTSRIAGISGPARGQGVKIRSEPEAVALTVPIKDPFLARRLRAAPAMQFRTGGPDAVEAALDETMLHGAVPALEEVRRCAADLKQKRSARFEFEHREQFRPDPPAVWVRGSGRN